METSFPFKENYMKNKYPFIFLWYHLKINTSISSLGTILMIKAPLPFKENHMKIKYQSIFQL